tara:strand:+ start:142 stop:564 length:423 start_codon:yes stop_codon:yes gene_type:complete
MGKKILVINGPNLEMLGKRDKSTYGDFSLESLEKLITEEANNLGCQVEFFQNNIEGEIINKLNGLDDSFDGIIINPGGLTHSSVSLHDPRDQKNLQDRSAYFEYLCSRRFSTKVSHCPRLPWFGFGNGRKWLSLCLKADC